jgi:hypothetical protein
MQIAVCIPQLEDCCRPPRANNDGLIVFEIAESATWGLLLTAIRQGTNGQLAITWGRRASCLPGGLGVYDAASTTALDVRPDFRFAIWPRPLFLASADRVAAYSGATIG